MVGAAAPALPASGRCPVCDEHFGPRRLVPEAAAAIAFAAIAVRGASGRFAAAQYWVAVCGVTLALIDLAVQRLPNVLTLPAWCHLVLGARALPAAFHAWVRTADGQPVGDDEAGGRDRPWTPIHTTP
jgi:prepilin signal peptidase PulO-like enzyme (type II secretory pathway)